MTTTTKDTRTIEIEIPVDAPPEAVWKALTDPDELARWFPLEARVEPGEGGSIAVSWGPEIQGLHRIRVWEPEKRLQTTWFEPTEMFGTPPPRAGGSWDQLIREDGESATRLVVDYYLEGREGGTLLRMVHSGFSRDARCRLGYSLSWTVRVAKESLGLFVMRLFLLIFPSPPTHPHGVEEGNFRRAAAGDEGIFSLRISPRFSLLPFFSAMAATRCKIGNKAARVNPAQGWRSENAP